MILWLLLILLLLALYLLAKIHFAQEHWQKLGVLVPKIKFPVGNSPVLSLDDKWNKIAFGNVVKDQYAEIKSLDPSARFYGIYMFGQKSLVVIDPDLMKDIMVKNFHCFTDRNGDNTAALLFDTGHQADKINNSQLAFLRGEEWKDARSTISPIFTSGKMKGMLHLVSNVGNGLMDNLKLDADEGKAVELKDIFERFSMDSIASCAFGVDAGCFKTAESEFVFWAKQLFRFEMLDAFKILALLVLPGAHSIFKMLKLPVCKHKLVNFFYNVVKSTLDYRSRNKIRRNDLVDLMLAATKSEDEDTKHEEEDEQFHRDAKLAHKRNKHYVMEEHSLVGSAFSLMIAGYDTTSQTLAYLGYKLALNPDIQRRLQDEIDTVLDGKDVPTYEDIANMEYLEAAFLETIRMYPPAAIAQRGCSQDYQIPGTDIWIRKGEEIFLSVIGIHYDPEFYPEPDVFNPDNFSKEARDKRHPYAFQGFGQGPRNCIGMRFALMEAKLAMARILAKYNIVKCDKTPETVTMDPFSYLGAPKEGLNVKLELRQRDD